MVILMTNTMLPRSLMSSFNNFLKDPVLGALLNVILLWKVLKLDTELLGSIVLVVCSNALVGLQVSNRQLHCCGVEGALVCNSDKYMVVLQLIGTSC